MTLKIDNPDLLDFINNNINFFSFVKKEISNSELICGAHFERAEQELKEKILAKYKVNILFDHDASNNISDVKIKINNDVEVSLSYKRNNLENPITVELEYQKIKKIFGVVLDESDDKIFLNPYCTNIYMFKDFNRLIIDYKYKEIFYTILTGAGQELEEKYTIFNEYLKNDFEKGLEIIKGNLSITKEDIDLFKLIKDIDLSTDIPNSYKSLKLLKKIQVKERKQNTLKIW